MKRLISLFCLLLLSLLPAACAPAAAQPAADNLQAANAVDSSASTAVEAATIDTNDLTLIGQTGRPQFLNAYAGW